MAALIRVLSAAPSSAAVVVGALLALTIARPAVGFLGDCGQPATTGVAPSAADALEILKTAVGQSTCGGFDPCICDVNSSGTVTASDALRTLQNAIGLPVDLTCPCIVTTTTTTLPEPILASEMMVLVRLQGTYSTADLAGTWDLHELEAGPGGPWWGRGTLSIASNGSFTGTIVGSDGSNDQIEGRLVVSGTGIITCAQNCPPGFNGALDSGKTVGTATTDTEDDGAELVVITRRGPSYAQSNLAGTWVLHSLTSGPTAPWWNRGPLMIASNGTFTGSLASPDGAVDDVSGTLPLSSSGAVTCTAGDCPNAFGGALDSGKTVVAATATDDDGSAILAVIPKQAASYAQADLTGTWRLNSIATGAAAPWWSRGTLTVASNGMLSGTITSRDGAMNPAEGTLTISPNGIVTISGDDDFECAMDADKTVIACTDSK